MKYLGKFYEAEILKISGVPSYFVLSVAEDSCVYLFIYMCMYPRVIVTRLLYFVYVAFIQLPSSVALGAHAQRGLLNLVVCLSVCMSDADIVSLHVERKVPMASTRYCADKDFAIDALFQSYGAICLPMTHSAHFSTSELSKGPKRLIIG